MVRADPANVHLLADHDEVDLVVMDETPNMDLLAIVVSTMQEVVQLIRGITAAQTRLVLAPPGGAFS